MKLLLTCLLIFTITPLIAKPLTLTIWTSNENIRDAIMTSAPAFEKEYKAKLQVNVLNKDVTGQFKTAALTGKGPDILAWAHDVVGELAESGLIEPLTLSPELKQALLPVAINAFTYKGRIYGYPYDLEAIALFINKDFGKPIPATMEQLVAEAKKMTNTKKGEYGFLYDIANLFFSFPFITAGGGYIFKDNNGALDLNDIGLDNAGAKQGVSFLADLANQGVVPSSTDRNIAFNKFKEGKLWATIDGPWALKDLRAAKINYQVLPIPTLNGGTPKPFVGTHGFLVRRSSKNKELAKEFIENYLVTKEGILNLYAKDPRGPTRKDALDILAAKDPDLLQFMLSASSGIPMPNVPEMGAVWGAMGNALFQSLKKLSTVEDALKEARKQLESTLAKSKSE